MSDAEDEGEVLSEKRRQTPDIRSAGGSVKSRAPSVGRKSVSKAPGKSQSQSSAREENEEFIPKNQRLFLVEFLIDTVTLDGEGFCEELMEGQTCVTLKFLHFPVMTICEKDFDPNKDSGIDKIRFNSGKSLMFAFAEKQCENPPPMMAELVVSKSCPEGSDVEKVDIGRIKVCMAQLFQQVYEVARLTPDRLPASKSIKECFMLIGKGKRTTGEIGIYIRLTCLGQNVVTEFQCGSDLKQDPILFKNREGKKIYQFTGAEKSEEGEFEDDTKFREGCGCLGPLPQKSNGGQGDAGRMAPSKRRTNMGGALTKGGRVVLDIPEKSKRCQGGCNNEKYKVLNKNTNYQVKPDNVMDPQKTKDELTMTQVNTNPDQNCFIMKVGDKGEIPDRGKMILEFRTPKQKILPKILPPYHEDIAVQTDSPKKAKGKGKAKKK